MVDNAGWRRSPKVILPPYSPELQPAERLWSLVDEVVANRVFADITELEDVLVARCQTLEAQPERLHAHTRYHWWPIHPAAPYAK